MNQFTGVYKVGPNPGQWIGATVLLQAGDILEITGDLSTSAKISVRVGGAGHLAGHDGEIKFMEDEKRALGFISAPQTNGSLPKIRFYVALRVSGPMGDRLFRATIMKDPTDSDDNGGEWDGEEEP